MLKCNYQIDMFLSSIANFDKSGLKPTTTVVRTGDVVLGKLDTKLYSVPGFDDLFISSKDAAYDYESIKAHSISHILCVAPHLEKKFVDKDVIYHSEEILDVPWEDLSKYTNNCVEFIDKAIQSGGKVLVHCHAGISRSASICIIYMMTRNNLTYDEAYRLLKQSRCQIYPNKGFVKQLREYQAKI
ncbi:dual specificity protein phosphatase 1B [Acrasis kona]|uniref:Dual specificity protein phosphatase 1B n=1 Tax=Acrasis kona TaxID=1008807 RepID=A0AAW2YRG6_9EUKA